MKLFSISGDQNATNAFNFLIGGGGENHPPQVYQKWLEHVEELKKNEAEHPQSPLRKTIE